jgi:osmoprotectant transport system permease protein
MGVLGDAFGFLTTAANWSGAAGIPNRLWEHVFLSVLSCLLAIAIAFPIGMYIGHTRRFRFLAVSVGNLGRALPSFGILGFVFPFTLEYSFPGEIGFSATLIAMVVLGIPPILLNSYIAIESVDRDVVEAARGMGMTERQLLLRSELPLGISLVFGGVRNAAVAIVATATLAAFFGWGGLGRFIIDGLVTRDFGQIISGALLVALLAITTEISLSLLERRLRSAQSEAETGEALGVPPLPAATA